jgi:hypothetical protein
VVAAHPEGDRVGRVVHEDAPHVGVGRQQVLDESTGSWIEAKDAIAVLRPTRLLRFGRRSRRTARCPASVASTPGTGECACRTCRWNRTGSRRTRGGRAHPSCRGAFRIPESAS